MEKWNFKVEKRDIFYQGERDDSPAYYRDKKALVRTDTNEVLSLVSDRYQETQHDEVFKIFDRVEGLNFDKYKLSDDGGVCFWEFNIDSARPMEVNKGDVVQFKFRAFNSHNFLTGRGGELIAYRLVCTNGMVMPFKASTLSFKHMANDFNDIHELVKKQYGNMDKMVETWQNWLTIYPSEIEVDTFVTKLELTNPETDYDMRQKMKAETNLWGVYNVLTKWLTHEMVNRGKNKIANQRKKSYEYTNAFYKYGWK